MQWQEMDIPFVAGLDAGSDSRSVDPPTLTRADNAAFDTAGQVIFRRPFSALGAAPANTRRIVAYGDELIAITDAALYSWSEVLETWEERAEYLSPAVTEQVVYASPAEQEFTDRAELDGVAVVVWTEDGEAKIAAHDVETGAVLLSPQSVPGSGTTKPRVIALTNRFHVYGVGSGGNLHVRTFTPDDVGNTASWTDTALGTSNDVRCYDIATDTPRTSVYFAAGRPDASLGSIYYLGDVTEGGVATVTGVGGDNDGGITIAARGTPGVDLYYVVVRTNGSLVEADLYDDSGVGTPVATDVLLGSIQTDDNQITAAFKDEAEVGGEFRCYAAWGSNEAPSGLQAEIRHTYINTNGFAGSNIEDVLRLGLASHAFTYDGSVYLWAAFAGEPGAAGMAEPLGFRSGLQNTYFLVNISAGGGQHLCKAIPGVGGGFGQINRHLGGVQDLGGGRYCWTGLTRRYIPTGDFVEDEDNEGEANRRAHQNTYAARTPVEVTLEFDSIAARRSAQIGRTLFVSGGEVMQYDGASLHELGFPINPWFFTATLVGAGAMAAGSYTYKHTLAHENAKGELDRSTTASHGVVDVDVPVSDSVNLSSVTVKETRRVNVALEAWRTIRNAPPGAPFRRVTGLDPNTTTGDNPYLVNNRSAGAVLWKDNLADDETIGTPTDILLRHQASPENGGVLENLAPPAATLIAAGQERMFLVTGPNEIRYSKYRDEGEVPSFHDILRVTLPEHDGDITALAMLGERLIVFKKFSTYVLDGIGLDNLGRGQNYIPVLRSSDVGAVSQEAVGVSSDGAIFKSHKGWHLIDPGFNIRYIGHLVESFDDEEIVAVHVLEDRHEVRALSAERLLVFNTKRNAWSSWTVTDGISATVWRGRYLYATADGIYQERDDYDMEELGVYDLDIEIAPIKFSGISRFGRIKGFQLVNEFRSECNIRTRVRYNYKQAYTDDKTRVFAEPDETPGDAIPFEHRFAQPKCQAAAVRLTITPVDPNAGDCLRMTGISVKLGIKPGLGRLGSSRVK
jgi:hypothetical protein